MKYVDFNLNIKSNAFYVPYAREGHTKTKDLLLLKNGPKIKGFPH